MARTGYPLGTAVAGDVASKAMESGKGNYLANLVLYPGEKQQQQQQQHKKKWYKCSQRHAHHMGPHM
jgi:hypothetical protein